MNFEAVWNPARVRATHARAGAPAQIRVGLSPLQWRPLPSAVFWLSNPSTEMTANFPHSNRNGLRIDLHVTESISL
jgi:hypothetical protein